MNTIRVSLIFTVSILLSSNNSVFAQYASDSLFKAIGVKQRLYKGKNSNDRWKGNMDFNGKGQITKRLHYQKSRLDLSDPHFHLTYKVNSNSSYSYSINPNKQICIKTTYWNSTSLSELGYGSVFPLINRHRDTSKYYDLRYFDKKNNLEILCDSGKEGKITRRKYHFNSFNKVDTIYYYSTQQFERDTGLHTIKLDSNQVVSYQIYVYDSLNRKSQIKYFRTLDETPSIKFYYYNNFGKIDSIRFNALKRYKHAIGSKKDNNYAIKCVYDKNGDVEKEIISYANGKTITCQYKDKTNKYGLNKLHKQTFWTQNIGESKQRSVTKFKNRYKYF